MRMILATCTLSSLMAISALSSAAPSCPPATTSDDGLETELHKKYVGQILFSKLSIDRLKATEANFTRSFGAGESLYLRLYLARALGNTCVVNDKKAKLDQSGSYQLMVSIDGKQKPEPFAFRALGDVEGRQKWTTFQLSFNPAPGDDKTKRDDVAGWKLALKDLPPGEHTVRVEAFAADYDPSGRMRSPEPIAAGEFKLLLREGEVVGATPLPQPARRDPALEKTMLAAVKEAGWEETPLKAIITASDWAIERSPLGVIEARSIAATVAVKTPKGTCRHFNLSFIQDRLAGSKFGPTKLKGTSDSFDIACDAIK